MLSFNRFILVGAILTVAGLLTDLSNAAEPVKVCKSKSVLVTTPAGAQHIAIKTVCVLTGARASR